MVAQVYTLTDTERKKMKIPYLLVLIASLAAIPKLNAMQEATLSRAEKEILNACRCPETDIQMIIKRLNEGARIEARDKTGTTAAHIAALLGNAGILALLIERQAAMDTADNAGRSPFITPFCAIAKMRQSCLLKMVQ